MSFAQGDPFAKAMAAQVAHEHAQPLFYSVYPLAIALGIISLWVLGAWLFRRKAWPYHPGGGAGFLRDEVIRYGSIWLPFSVIMVGVRYYVYRFHPELASSPYFYVFYLSIIFFRRLARQLPHVKEIGARIDAARAAARAAKEAGQ
ncbi:MAG TPA: hypothetical protein VG839_04525 [Asticcacaulis sp.]|nr:hypothetical protein [Asticcacaulis sp.]